MYICKSFYSTDTQFAGDMLEISLRVGVISLNVPQQHQTIFLSLHSHKESRSLFKVLYFLYFVLNFAQIILLDLFEYMKSPLFCQKFGLDRS